MNLFTEIKDLILKNSKTLLTIITVVMIFWVSSNIFYDLKRYYSENYMESFCDKDTTLPHLRSNPFE